MRVAFCLPISREWCVEPILKFLKFQQLDDQHDIEYFFHFDDHELYEKYNLRLGFLGKTHFIVTGDGALPDHAPNELRRQRICNIWEDFQNQIPPNEFQIIAGLEDDTIPPDGAFHELIRMLSEANVAFTSGVEAGRHGLKMIGGWNVSDSEVSTVAFQDEGRLSVDAAGLYCFATWARYFHGYEFHSEAVCLGPDVTFLRDVAKRHGGKGLLDFNIKCKHLQYNQAPLLVDEECIVLRWIKEPLGWHLQYK